MWIPPVEELARPKLPHAVTHTACVRDDLGTTRKVEESTNLN